MNMLENSESVKHTRHLRSIAGILLVLSGGLLFIDQYLQTGWLSYLVLPGAGLFLYLWGVRLRAENAILAGGILGGLGLGSLFAFSGLTPRMGLIEQIGNLLLMFGLGWLAVTAGTWIFTTRPALWTMIPGGVLSATGACLLVNGLRWTDLILYAALGVAVPFLVWGLSARLVGLIIPGSLLLGVGPGIYMAWGVVQPQNGLVQTGIMLVWFSLGWFLITVFSRVIIHRFAWWPLIPGGIVATVGCGLYIGGDPGNALGFIGNTGSIGLMIFGLYLLLMRKGIHH